MANRLGQETSPYLLQHKDNPVDWRSWSPEALADAADADRPLLVSIGYSSCHWCHVMERESFEDAEVAAYMNENFIPIKVDREERPDVDAIYMEAVQAMTGHGGWPLTAFCDPAGVPFYTGTYFPPEPRQGLPSFRMVMEAVVESWHTQRERIEQSATEIRARLGAVASASPSGEPLSPAIVESGLRDLRMLADMRHGGFGGAPKFPPASALELLMARGETGITQITLDSMAAGGIFDQLAGGFARYSVDAHWLIPHFEKMLYDNALLATAYLHGWQLTGNERWRTICERTLDWALAEMRGPEGGFFSALDADSEGEEGRFYAWEASEFREVLRAAGIEDIDGIAAYWGVTDTGNFEGRNVLHLARGLGDEEPAELGRARAALLERRAARVPPGLDDKRLCSWNALLLAALAEAGAVLDREDYLDAARESAEFIWREMRDSDGRLLRTWKDGRAHLAAYLEDYAYLTGALLTLYEASFDTRWFEAARETADRMIELFADTERGAFFTTAHDHEKLIARRKDVEDHPIPSGNSAAALALLRLAALTGERTYEERAVSVFRLLGHTAARHPQALAHLLLAMDFHFARVREVALVAPTSGDGLAALAATVRAKLRPHLVLAGGVEGTQEPGLMRERSALGGRAAAYVCEDFACQRPVSEPDELAALLD